MVCVCLSVCWSGELYKTSAAAQGPKPPKNLTAIDPRQAVLLHAEVFQPPQQRQSAAERRHLVAGHVETSQRRDRVGRRQVATDGPCRRLTTAATIRCHDLLWAPPSVDVRHGFHRRLTTAATVRCHDLLWRPHSVDVSHGFHRHLTTAVTIRCHDPTLAPRPPSMSSGS